MTWYGNPRVSPVFARMAFLQMERKCTAVDVVNLHDRDALILGVAQSEVHIFCISR
jgi:hypothetical protein